MDNIDDCIVNNDDIRDEHNTCTSLIMLIITETLTTMMTVMVTIYVWLISMTSWSD